MSEDQLQAKCYQWLHNHHPWSRGFFFAIPNGGKRTTVEAMKLKATGVVRGVVDCLLIWPVLTGFEFKTESGVLSPDQIKIHALWGSKSITVHVVRDFSTFEKIIEGILKQNETK